MKNVAIVLAAGRGRRMNSERPKQYLEIAGKPVLYYALKSFEDSSIDEIVLVTQEEEIQYCQKEIIEKYQFKKISKIVAGGTERYFSVLNGLRVVERADYVFIHDGARPFISVEAIERLALEVQKSGACIAGVPAKDTVKIADSDNKVIETPPRESVWIVQTPQVFSYAIIRDAYEKMIQDCNITVTDDAMVLEKYGTNPVHMVMCDYTNIKITTPEDLEIAETFLRREG